MPAEGELPVDEWVVDDEAKEALTCAVCLNIFHQPVHLSTCSHTFCLHCLRAHANQPHPNCPQCVTPLSDNIRSLLSSDECIDGSCSKQLSQLRVSCPYCRQWKGVLGVDRANVIVHRSECGDYPEICGVSCGQSIARSRLAAHERDECPRREVECERCNEPLPFESLAQHHINARECEKCHLCLLGCGELVLDRCIADHHKHHCPRRSVQCPTCGLSLEYRQLDAHLHTNFIDHFTQLATDNLSFRVQLAAMQDEMASLRRQLSASQFFPSLTSDVQSAIEWLDSDAASAPASMTAVVGLMREYRDLSDGQFAGYKRLLDRANASNGGELQHMADEGGIVSVVSAMNLHLTIASVQEAGCGVLWRLADGADACLRIAAAGGIRCIVLAMKHHATVMAVQEHGCAALARLARRPAIRGSVVSAGGLECVVLAMRTHPLVVRIRETGCQALCSWVYEADSCQRLAAAGGVENIVAVLRQHSSIAPLPDSEFAVLAHLASQPSLCRRVLLAGGVDCLVSAIRHQVSVSRIVEVASALRHMTASVLAGDDVRFLAAGGLMEALVAAMNQHTSVLAIQENGCAALLCMARRPVLRERLTSAGVVECVVSAMNAHSALSVQDDGVLVLCNLSEEKGSRARIAAAGGKETILAAMKKFPANLLLQSFGNCALNRIK